MVHSSYVHFAVCGLLALTGLVAILFGLMRGSRVRARLPFALGGLVLILYAAAYGVTYYGSRLGVLAGMAEGVGGATEQTRLIRKLEALSYPAAALEPIAVLMLALGFGALSRGTQSGAQPGSADMPVPDTAETEDDELFGGVAGDDAVNPEDATRGDDSYPFDD